ncbi:MAG TPA: Gldg family protein [Candidatus Hydrogenedentes bacterium]|nr:Gldg family protein [Candidatus Hydrogenedentota bacterium]HPG69907.1 Gldg family protein [Candidatus Hydrogenedentota bacterium]
MRNIVTILRRELSAYFTSPVGYIFMIVYVLISVGLYITSFFTFPVADMRPYFNNLPILLCVFIPAVTMRVWAEDRKENTWEMLLTFPMKSRELVVGKFLAALVFFALTVAATVTVPIMLASLGNPDNGGVLGGYLGTLLLGAFFLAIGIFFSGFFKDQIVAFVVTLLTCFAVFLVGTDFIAGYVDSMRPGLGSLLSVLVGVFDHYASFTRGVIEVADLLYFGAWTVLFILLNVMYIEGRGRPRARTTFATAVIVCTAIGLLFNWLLVGQSLGRFDMTEDKIYTVSEASKDILAKLDTPVQVTLYITPKDKMPTGMTQLEQDIADKIQEIGMASNGKLEFKTIHMEVANALAPKEEEEEEQEEGKEEALEKRMLDKGVEPFSVRAIGEDEVTNKLVYSSIGVGYKDREEEIIPQVMPQTIEELEYRLVSTVHKLTRDKKPVVALVAPKEAVSIDPQMKRMLEQMGQQVPTSEDPYVYLQQILQVEKYDVQRVELTQESPLPEEYDTLAVINPRSLNERQRWEINRAIVQGKSVVLAVQNYEWDYRPTRRGTTLSRRDEKPEINALLEHYGITVSEDILMDKNHVPLTVQGGSNDLASLLGMGQTVNLPIHIIVNNTSMDQSTSVTNRLSSIFYLWGSPLTVDEDKVKQSGLEVKPVMWSSDSSWTFPGSDTPSAEAFEGPPSGQEMKRYPLMAMVSGQFPDAFKDAERPEWPEEEPQMPNAPPKPPKPEEAEAGPVTPAPGKMILLGCSEMFRKNFLQAGNLDLFLNAVDAVTLGDELVQVRSRKPINRTIDKPSASTRTFWKIVNYTFAATVIAAVGILSAAARRRARNAYTIRHSGSE